MGLLSILDRRWFIRWSIGIALYCSSPVGMMGCDGSQKSEGGDGVGREGSYCSSQGIVCRRVVLAGSG